MSSVDEEQAAGRAFIDLAAKYTSEASTEEGTVDQFSPPSDVRALGADLLSELEYLGYKLVREKPL